MSIRKCLVVAAVALISASCLPLASAAPATVNAAPARVILVKVVHRRPHHRRHHHRRHRHHHKAVVLHVTH